MSRRHGPAACTSISMSRLLATNQSGSAAAMVNGKAVPVRIQGSVTPRRHTSSTPGVGNRGRAFGVHCAGHCAAPGASAEVTDHRKLRSPTTNRMPAIGPSANRPSYPFGLSRHSTACYRDIFDTPYHVNTSVGVCVSACPTCKPDLQI